MKRYKKLYWYKVCILLILISTVFVFTSCGASTKDSAQSTKEELNYDSGYGAPVAYPSPKIAESRENSLGSTFTSSVDNIYQTEQMIIYNGTVIIDVKDINDATIEIEQLIKKAGGYLINSNKSENDVRYYARYEYKIPVDNFHLLIDQINELTIGKVKDQYINGNDVTEEYLDIDSRLKAKKVYEKRLLDLFDQAKSTEDLLKISNDLSRVQEEIEQLEGRQKYLSYHAANSTLAIEMSQYKDKVSPTANSWEKSIEGFKQSIKFIKDLFASLFVWLISSLPIFILIAVIILVLWVIIRNRIKRLANKKAIVAYEDNSDKTDTN